MVLWWCFSGVFGGALFLVWWWFGGVLVVFLWCFVGGLVVFWCCFDGVLTLNIFQIRPGCFFCPEIVTHCL